MGFFWLAYSHFKMTQKYDGRDKLDDSSNSEFKMVNYSKVLLIIYSEHTIVRI